MNVKYLQQWCFFFLALFVTFTADARQPSTMAGGGTTATVVVESLPQEVRQTLDLIRRGPPFPYAKDGAVFRNYEKRLPGQPRGYYREFTVRTPGSRNRGARRLVVGGPPATSAEVYYTADHYESFARIRR